MIEAITNINNAVNNVVWGWPAVILLGFVGVLMTCLTKFFQVSHFGHWMKKTIGAIFADKHVTKHTSDKSISQFQSLCTALAATVGTGNIVGVAGAIAVGGPGSIFWMWVIAFFGMMTNYSENVLGILYRRKNAKGEWAGGAMYYLKDGLGSKKHCKYIGLILATLFSIFCLIASFGIGNLAQIQSIVSNVNTAFKIPPYATGIFLFIFGWCCCHRWTQKSCRCHGKACTLHGYLLFPRHNDYNRYSFLQYSRRICFHLQGRIRYAERNRRYSRLGNRTCYENGI